MSTCEFREDELRRSRRIRQELQKISERARQRYPLLAYQDAIGLTILAVSTTAIVANALAYADELMPAWLVILSSAFFLSLLHELEHDLIHRIYFKSRPYLYNASMMAVWIFRPGTINPWVRRDWHLHHHRVSGTATDIEERVLTNGEPWNVRRLLMSLDTFLSLALRPRTVRTLMKEYALAHKPKNGAELRSLLRRNQLSLLPFAPLYFFAWHGFLYVHAAHWLCLVTTPNWAPPPLMDSSMQLLDFLAVVIVVPNALRTFCLHFVSSNIHYYGDIEPRNVIQQAQVWNALWLLPLQAFCFNFGSTHAIHHFWVQDPFYLRQLVAVDAHRVMRKNGVRFNDFATMLRANRWLSHPSSSITSEVVPWSESAPV